MSTDHMTEGLEDILTGARRLKQSNDNRRQALLTEQEQADAQLVEDVEALTTVARAIQQRHEDESEERDQHLAQANRIAGVRVTPEPVDTGTTHASTTDTPVPTSEPASADTLPPVASVPDASEPPRREPVDEVPVTPPTSALFDQDDEMQQARDRFASYAPFTREEIDSMSVPELQHIILAYMEDMHGDLSGVEVREVLDNNVESELRDMFIMIQHMWCMNHGRVDPAWINPSPPPVPAPEPAPAPVVVEEPPHRTAEQQPVSVTVNAPPVVPERQRSRYHISNWSHWCWWSAAIGAFIGFVVGIKTRGVVTDEVHAWKWVPGLIWVLAIMAIGFAIGAFICIFVCEWRNNRDNRTDPQPA